MAAEKLPETLSVHLTREQKARFEMICSFDGETPSGAMRAFVIAEIQKWETRFQSMQQVFKENSSTGSASSDVGERRHE